MKKLLDTESEVELIPLILSVEDDLDNQLLLKYIIDIYGWRSIFAANALEAISMAKKHQPDLILLDIVLPDISGLQIAMMLKADRKTRSIPLIAVTGLSSKQEKDLIFATGFDDYVCKPYALEELQTAIASHLENKLAAI
ncbi:response regulator [Pleurocapsa sp. FMAR1]|uniref:response regulator n=1 Tax=Pleurocapsa sp. FMAR1 TaxID=3040204 RepID=UPI0029C65E99|nr:response regulator [Pleurocapsa sp. FMAR1]